MLRASVVCAALVLASPAPAQTLRIGLQADPATLDPAQSVSFVDRVVMAAVCDKLIELDAKLDYVPQLATEWAWAADGLSLTHEAARRRRLPRRRAARCRGGAGSTSSATRPRPIRAACPS